MFKQWDVWTVYWEHRDLLAATPGKVRPALLISDEEETARGGDLMFMKISTQRYAGVPDLPIQRSDGDEFTCAGLAISPSYIHYTSIQRLSRGDVGKRIGYAGAATVELLIDLMEDERKRRGP